MEDRWGQCARMVDNELQDENLNDPVLSFGLQLRNL
jgi:hypothetical protein